MHQIRSHAAAAFLLPASFFATPLQADVLRVVADIAPTHSLVAQVMGALGSPDLLLPPGADPHDFALRPSDAERLAQADLVIWTGAGLTPWLAQTLTTLAPDAARLALLDIPGWTALPVRDIASFAPGAGDSDHDHDHDHDHADTDPHAWLDPATAQVWVMAIAAQLGAADPENAATYTANAVAAVQALRALDADLAAQTAGLPDRAHVLPHDGYQYFETRYNLTAAGAIAGIDARTPGPAQIESLRARMVESNIACVFSDAEIGDRWAVVVTEGTAARTARIDGIGAGLVPGPGLYDALLRRLGAAFVTCLGGNG